MQEYLDSIVAINKPKGPTSNDILTAIKKKLSLKKGVGHAGTLDPLASGVLLVGIGKATKKLDKLLKNEKEYIASIRLGMNSTTDDAEGSKEKIDVKKIPSRRDIDQVLKKFIGIIQQQPPIYSAIKIKGKKAYQLARAGKKVNIKPREVEIKNIEIIKYQWPYLEIKVITGPGVYIRSLARDIGGELGTGGYIAELVRTRVGEYKLDDALAIDQIKKINHE